MMAIVNATWPCACPDSKVSFTARVRTTFHAAPRHTKSNSLFLVKGIGDECNRRRYKQRHRLRHIQAGSNSEGDASLSNDQVQVDDILKDYMNQFDNSTSQEGGGLRWFSPLDCGLSSNSSYDSVDYDDKASSLKSKSLPLLLYLPGIDGTGLGLVRNHHKLNQIFDMRCLHIPVTDRTPFSELVKLVEGTVKSEYNMSPNRPIYLVGESVGACLALAVAANNPNIDLMLIVANPAGTSFDRSNLLQLKPLLEWMSSQSFPGGEAMSVFMDDVLKRLPQPRILKDMFEGLETLIYYFSVVRSTLSVATLLWKIELLKTSSAYVNSRLHAIKAPTLLLSSGRDILLPSLEEGEKLSHVLPNCDFRSFKVNGHFLFLEDGVDLVATIKAAGFYRRGKHLDRSADYLRPTPSEYLRTASPYNRFFNPATSPVMLSTLDNGEKVKGLAGIPGDGPTLLVGYHSLCGLEVVPLVSSFFEQRNIILRGISHPELFQKPKVARYFDPSLFDPLRVMGCVPASAPNLIRLLDSKSHVLLYPGGVQEALHRKGEFYKLFWPEKPEFVRIAARCGATIVPFGVVGIDDLIDLVVDYDDISMFPFISELIKENTSLGFEFRSNRSGELNNEIAHMPIITPKVPGRFYFLFGKPIDTKGRMEELRNEKNARDMYLDIKSEVEKCIAYLKERREHDPYRNIFPRLLYQSIHGFTSEVPTFEL